MWRICWAWPRLSLDYGADEDEAIAALLHDAIEDQGGTASQWARKLAGGLGRRWWRLSWLHRCRHHSQAALAGAKRCLFGQAGTCFALDSAGRGGR